MLILSYLVRGVIPFTLVNNSVTVGSIVSISLIVATSSLFTYGVVRIEQSRFNVILDHLRHTLLFYFFLIAILIHDHAILYLAFIPGYEPLAQEKMLTYEKQSADLSVTWLIIFLAIIVSNLIVLCILKRRWEDAS